MDKFDHQGALLFVDMHRTHVGRMSGWCNKREEGECHTFVENESAFNWAMGSCINHVDIILDNFDLIIL